MKKLTHVIGLQNILYKRYYHLSSQKIFLVRHLMKNFATVVLFMLFACQSLTAQLCQGSLGDPIVNITFGAGSNPGPQLAAAATGYQFFSQDCPADGFYTVRNSTVGCFNNSWFAIPKDHTGDANGYFMLINASLAPSAFYLDTVKGLCANTTFEFAAWVINVLQQSACMGNGIQPNLTFSIENTDGTLLKSYNTNNIPSSASPTWQQFGFFFTTPPNVSSIVLRIVNNANGGCGNDLALDDITFRPCGPMVSIAIDGNPQNTAHICYGTPQTVTFTSAISQGFSNPSFQWQKSAHNGIWTDIPGATNDKLTQFFADTTSPGVYDYRVTAAEAGNINSAGCRVASVINFVEIDTFPVKSAANNGPVCEHATLLLNATGGATYQWTGPGNFSSTAASITVTDVQQTQAGKYNVQVISQYGCALSDSTFVTVKPAPVAAVTFTHATICTGKNIELISSGGGTYAWLPDSTLSNAAIANPIASPAINTQYVVTVTNSFACTDTAAITIDVNESPTANAGPDKTIIAGTTIQLLATATGKAVTYLWAPNIYIDDAHVLQPMVYPPVDTDYILNVTSANGCGTATDTMHVFVFKGIFIPSAFSPNGDGLNDAWKIPALNAFPSFELSVFDRFGHLIFQNSNSNIAWDGTYKGQPAPAGTYVYLIDLKKAPGILKGAVLLIR